MERRMGGRTLAWGAALVLPTLLVLLFETRKWDRALMDRWVSGVMAPLEQQLGRFWGQISWCSAAELLTALLLAGCVLWLIWTVAGLLRRRDGRAFGRRLLALAAVLLWLWCGFCWMWNAAYYASSFQEKSGLRVQPYPVETLIQVTALFAQRAAEFSTQVERDENGRFAVSRDEILARGPEVYENVVREYPFLALEGQTAAKPIFFSRLQSRLGFTGVYFPFTGEANVNVDAPVCLLPATVAHEMAHQRMVASEQEANFVGILAAVTSGDPVYQYSGYLMGLIPFLQRGSLPYHTLLINVLGAILIGMIVKTADSTELLSPAAVLFLKVGVCGGFTTFSTFSLESLDLLESGRPAAFAVYALASVALCVAGVLGGKWLAGTLQA